MSARHSPLLILAVAILGTLPGCFSEKFTVPKTVPVSGSVTLKGRPVAGVRVTLHPQFDMDDIVFVPSGETGRDGKFVISTGVPGNGAPKGDYVVTLEKPIVAPSPDDGLESEIDQLKGAYSDPEKSSWKVTLVDGENVLEPFQLN